MEFKHEHDLQLTDEEQAVLDKAIELLMPFDKEDVSYTTVYFEAVDEDGDPTHELDLGEYDCCDNSECIQATMEEIQSSFKDHKIGEVYWDNSGDNERINSCHNCGRPLNSQLTCIRQELDHHLAYPIDANPDSRTAFDLKALFEAMPSIDERLGEYEWHQRKLGNVEPYNKTLKRQREFFDEVLVLAKHVIETLSQPL